MPGCLATCMEIQRRGSYGAVYLNPTCSTPDIQTPAVRERQSCANNRVGLSAAITRALVVCAAMGLDDNNLLELSANSQRQYSRGPISDWLHRVLSGTTNCEVLVNEN